MRKIILFISLFVSFLFASCCKEINANPTELSLFVGDQATIFTTNEKVTFNTSNPYHASVDEIGLVTANKVGQTNITIESKKETTNVPVTIEPRFTYFDEPFLVFGSSINEVVEHHGNYTMEINNWYIFNNYGPHSSILSFKFEDDVLTAVEVTIDLNDGGVDIEGFMLERYTPTNTKVEQQTFTNDLSGLTPASIKLTIVPEVDAATIRYEPYNNK